MILALLCDITSCKLATFRNTIISLPVIEDIPMDCHIQQRQNITIDYHSLISEDKVPKNEKILIHLLKWSAKYEFVVPFGFENIKKELRFKKKLVEKAQQKLHEIKKKFYNADESDVVFVGMHYRGTDMIKMMRRELKDKFFEPPSCEYYNAAITYFQQKYKKAIFILITIDFAWLDKNKKCLKHDINLVTNPVHPQSAINDLILLSHCNHSITAYGTYSTTAALFAGGTTFVYDLGIPLDFDGPTLTMGLAEMLSNWYKIGNNGRLVSSLHIGK
ncbi:uncharacterized protein LOC108734597 isoform X2 [Agrilus planipennis]|uniref:L-Fucosyltransferase n=1 Tax=Agrilus planipennis TaxID=224129 RepID=A0A7F5RAX3_AGRPL|nr:uncharacterized protein LOC108734597 isoform X2 [Agrilus planipennis]